MKKQVNFSFNSSLANEFDVFCKEYSFNKTALIERLIKEYMEKFDVEQKLS